MGAIAGNSGIGSGLLSRRLRVVRRPARRARGRDQLGLRGLRRGVRIEHRGRRHDGEARGAGDAQAPLRQGARLRHGRERRHARCADPAEHPVRALRRVRRSLDRQAADRRHHAGPAHRHGLHDHDHDPLLAQSLARAAGRVPRPRGAVARALGVARRDLADHRADRGRDRRALCRRRDADRGRRGRRVPRDRDRLPAPPTHARGADRQLQGRGRRPRRSCSSSASARCCSRASSRSPAPPTCSPS